MSFTIYDVAPARPESSSKWRYPPMHGVSPYTDLGTDNKHSDSDWLTTLVTLGNPVTKSVRTLQKTHHMEGAIKAGNFIKGPFESDSFKLADNEVVVVNYLVTNLGSSKAEEQFAQAVKVTNEVVGVVAPIAGAVIGIVVGGNPGEGAKIGKEIAKGFDTAIDPLGDVFDFLDIHAGPPNYNGEVLKDTLSYDHNAWLQAVNQPASREYTGPEANKRCGSPSESKLNFSVKRFPPGGIFGPEA